MMLTMHLLLSLKTLKLFPPEKNKLLCSIPATYTKQPQGENVTKHR